MTLRIYEHRNDYVWVLSLTIAISIYDSQSRPDSVVIEACGANKCEQLLVKKSDMDGPKVEKWINDVSKRIN